MSLETADILELMDRYNYLALEYVKLAGEMVPLMEKFGKYKQELQALVVEFSRRGIKPDDPEPLKKMVEEELVKRGIKIDE